MKIRQGFVSNSSSSSFVIAVPRDFEITDDIVTKLKEEVNKYSWRDDDWTEDKIREQLPKTIDELCSGDGLFADYYGPMTPELGFELAKVADLIIASFEGGPDEGQTVNILADDNKESTLRKIKGKDED